MQVNRYTIVGHELVTLVAEIQGVIGQHYAIVHDPVVVLITEHYYFRNESTLQVTLVCAFVDDHTCRVEIISGGGSTGWLNVDWGTEDTSNQRLFVAIKKICTNHGWTMTEEAAMA